MSRGFFHKAYTIYQDENKSLFEWKFRVCYDSYTPQMVYAYFSAMLLSYTSMRNYWWCDRVEYVRCVFVTFCGLVSFSGELTNKEAFPET